MTIALSSASQTYLFSVMATMILILQWRPLIPLWQHVDRSNLKWVFCRHHSYWQFMVSKQGSIALHSNFPFPSSVVFTEPWREWYRWWRLSVQQSFSAFWLYIHVMISTHCRNFPDQNYQTNRWALRFFLIIFYLLRVVLSSYIVSLHSNSF